VQPAPAYRTLHRVALAALLALLFVGPATALEKAEQNCVNTQNKNFQKVAAAYGKEICGCLKDFAKEKGVTDIAACVLSDRKGKLAKAAQKALDGDQSKCASPPTSLYTGAANANEVARDKELELLTILFGSDVDGTVRLESEGKDTSKCQLKIAKDLKKCQNTKLKAFNSCKKAVLKAGGGVAEVDACVEGLASNAKVGKACDKVSADLAGKCVSKGVDLLTAFPSCGAADANTVAACLETPVECGVCAALKQADALNVNCDLFDDGSINQSCPSDLTLANLNILHGAFCPPGQCRQSERVDLFFQWLAGSGCPDVVTLQEVIQFPALEIDMIPLLQAQLGSVCPFSYELVFQPTTGIDEEVILTRYAVLRVEQLVLFQGFRKVLHARVDHPIGPLDVFTTHLASGSDLGSSPCGVDCPGECLDANAVTIRDCQAVQMAEYIELLHDVDTPAVATGDFNSPPGSFVYNQFVGRGWTDTHLAAGNLECNPGTGVGCTSGRESEDLSELESPVANVGSRIDFTFLIPPGLSDACAGTLDGPSDADGDGTATRIFADAPNPFAPPCGPAPAAICWPSDHEGTELDLNCD